MYDLRCTMYDVRFIGGTIRLAGEGGGRAEKMLRVEMKMENLEMVPKQ